MRFYSDNPHRDFDRWDAFQEGVRESHRKGKCSQCHEAVYDYDDYYDIDGDLLHDECLLDWAAQFKK